MEARLAGYVVHYLYIVWLQYRSFFEKSLIEMRSRGPGLAVQGEIIDFLKGHNITTEEAASIPAYKRKYLRRNGKNQTLHLMTSWNMPYYQLIMLFLINYIIIQVNSFEQTKDHVIIKFLWK